MNTETITTTAVVLDDVCHPVADLADALDAWAARHRDPHKPLLGIGATVYSAQSLADSYRAGVDLVCQLLHIGLRTEGIDKLLAALDP